MYQRITLTTDFSEASYSAFLHALALARRYRSILDILHVRDPNEEAQWLDFPQVRATLQAWGVPGVPSALDRNATVAGMRINKVDVPSGNATESIARYAAKHGSDLLVAASHGRSGLKRLLHGSVTEELIKLTQLPTLLIGPDAQGFASAETGSIRIERVIVPIAAQPSPKPAFDELVQLMNGEQVKVRPFHVMQKELHFDNGTYEGLPVTFGSGDIAKAVLAAARDFEADLLVMATEGNRGLKDKVFGSTTSQVLMHAPCPVLVVPVQP